jgi:hypothetical protein
MLQAQPLVTCQHLKMNWQWQPRFRRRTLRQHLVDTLIIAVVCGFFCAIAVLFFGHHAINYLSPAPESWIHRLSGENVTASSAKARPSANNEPHVHHVFRVEMPFTQIVSSVIALHTEQLCLSNNGLLDARTSPAARADVQEVFDALSDATPIRTIELVLAPPNTDDIIDHINELDQLIFNAKHHTRPLWQLSRASTGLDRAPFCALGHALADELLIQAAYNHHQHSHTDIALLLKRLPEMHDALLKRLVRIPLPSTGDGQSDTMKRQLRMNYYDAPRPSNVTLFAAMGKDKGTGDALGYVEGGTLVGVVEGSLLQMWNGR